MGWPDCASLFRFRQDLPAAARGFAHERLVQPPRVLTRGEKQSIPSKGLRAAGARTN